MLYLCKFQNSPLIENFSRFLLIFLSTATFHPLSPPLSGGGRGSSRATIQRLDRLSATATTIERFLGERGMAGQRYSRQYRGAIESRYLVHGPAPPLFCQVLLPRASPRFGNATLQVEAIRASWKSPRLTFVPITPSLINYAAQAVGLESIRGRRRPPLPSRSCSFHRPLEFLFPNTFLLYVAFRDF